MNEVIEMRKKECEETISKIKDHLKYLCDLDKEKIDEEIGKYEEMLNQWQEYYDAISHYLPPPIKPKR